MFICVYLSGKGSAVFFWMMSTIDGVDCGHVWMYVFIPEYPTLAVFPIKSAIDGSHQTKTLKGAGILFEQGMFWVYVFMIMIMN